VTAINDRGELKLDTYCKELRKEIAVIKSTSLIHLRNDIKLFAVLNCIQDTPFMKLFLNPNLNKMDRNDGITSFNLEFKMTSIKLCPEQRIVIKKLSYECTKDDTEKIIFINGAGGSGKTYMMLAGVLNLKFCLKDKKRYLICTSTMSGLDEIAETLYNMPHSSALNIVRIGYREQLIGSGRKLGINEQVQQKINNGMKGKSYKEIQKEIIENADIILSTCKSCYDLFDYQLEFDICFIDEANFAIDAELMILVQLNVKKMVLIGDEYQLEPTQSLVYKETRCNNSYFNRIINYYKSIKFANAPVFTLLTQHRMNKDLFNICTK
jgi:superfamily I DNA and/or RNA helicase